MGTRAVRDVGAMLVMLTLIAVWYAIIILLAIQDDAGTMSHHNDGKMVERVERVLQEQALVDEFCSRYDCSKRDEPTTWADEVVY